MPVTTSYARGKIKSATVMGRGTIIPNQTEIDNRLVTELIMRDGRLYFATNETSPGHVIGSVPVGMVGLVLRDPPEIDVVDEPITTNNEEVPGDMVGE